MKNLLKIVLCASIILNSSFLLLNSAYAQITHASQGRYDENASALLKKAAKKFSSVSFSVKMTVLDSQKKEVLSQQAEVAYLRGKYRLTMQGQEIISDGTTVWHWNKGAKEVTVSKVSFDDDVDLLNPSRMLTNYDKAFRAKYIRTEDDGTAIIDMQPRSARSYHKIRLFIDEKSGTLKRLEVHKFDSSREIYDFSKHKYSTPSVTFVFKPEEHPGVEVIDMR